MPDKPAKVLIVISSLDKGGAEKQIYLLVSRCANPNLVFHIATRRSTSNPDFYRMFEKTGIKIFDLDHQGTRKLCLIKALRSILRDNHYDILQSYLSGDNILCALSRIGRDVVFLSGYRGDYGNPVFKRTLIQQFRDYFSWLTCNKIISNNYSGIKYLLTLPFIDKDDIHIIRNGIDLPTIHDERAINDIRIIGSLGNLWDYKNHSILFRALPKLSSSIQMKIAGEGDQRAIYANLLSQQGINPDDVLLGSITDTSSFLSNIDIFIYPSLREGSPNSLLEAMAHKKFCMASDIPENREALGEVPAECFFDPYNENDLVSKIVFWQKNIDGLNIIAAQNRRRINANFSIAQYISSYETTYFDLLGQA